MAGTVQPQQMTTETAPSTVVMQTALPKAPQPKQIEKTPAKTEKQSKRPEKTKEALDKVTPQTERPKRAKTAQKSTSRTTRSAKRRISSNDSEQSVPSKKTRK